MRIGAVYGSPPPHMPQLEEQLPPVTARTGPSRAPSRKDPPHLWFQTKAALPGPSAPLSF